ncbi:N-acetyltransferase [Pseudomonas luteola]|uniref:GNAT family N-acetyltransferase n=1 Tax=Pseudomonas luteola TaxID=47886 RepID=UPI000F772D2A|nr:GNAT family N-acetyltransferase [Pseudomonas luteola]RRW44115.1 N-acetyltransferase [Pseudomonas luteola]
MNIVGPELDAADQCEQLLRSLPRWFGIESALLEYVKDTRTLPIFAAYELDLMLGFISLKEHCPGAWEISCIAVHPDSHGQGVGRRLHEQAEVWLRNRGTHFLQVKTLAASHPSPEYARTRGFYERMGYHPLEVFTDLWGSRLPVLQLVKCIYHS